MIHQRYRLGIIGFVHPNLFDPLTRKLGVEFFERGSETLQQFFIAHRKIFVTQLQIIARVHNMVAAEMFLRHKIRMLHQRQHRVACLLGQVEPVIALAR